MMLFKTFWKVVSKYKGTIILYTVMLICFGGINMAANNNTMGFSDVKPPIAIVNEDDSVIANNLVNYLKDKSTIKDIDNNYLDDALFYRDISYIIYIPSEYGKSVFTENPKTIEVKSSGDYKSTLASNILLAYLKVQDVYKDDYRGDELIDKINSNLDKSANIKIKSKLDTTSVSNASNYYSFASYSIIAVILFIICLVMCSFNEKNVRRRTIISSINLSSYNMSLLGASLLYGFVVFVLFNILALVLVGDIMFSLRGLVYVINSFVFTIVTICLSLLLSTLVKNKNAISGIVNVVALGSAFLCGALVPASMLPNSVLKFAHILPAYYYINTNDLLKSIEEINYVNLEPIFKNMFILVLFILLFIILNNIISRLLRKRNS